MGLGDFLSGVKDAAVNVGKGAAWAVRPDHWDDIAEGVGKAGEFAMEHPGQVWDTGFEVGRAVLKDQLDPVNLAINAGLLAATVATGGAAAPAFIAKLGMGAKSIEAGIAGAKAVETGVEAVKAVETGVGAVKAVESGVRGAKAVETGVEAARAGSTALEAGEAVGKTAQTGSRLARVVDKGLGLEPGKFGKGVSNVLNPIENSRFGAAAMRERAAGRILEAGGEAPGFARQATAALVQGGGRGAGAPTQLAGMSDKVYAAQKMAARGAAVQKRIHQAGQFSEGVKIAADPMKAVEGRVNEEIDKRAVDTGYVDRGQTSDSLYGDTSSTAVPASSSSTGGGGAGGSGGRPPGAPPGAAPPPGSSGSWQSGSSSTTSSGVASGTAQPAQPAMKKPTNRGISYGSRGQHLWEGPRSQWLGGVQANYDWRPVDPLRAISSPSTAQAGRYARYKGQMREYNAQQSAPESGSDLNEQGAPQNFSPEVPKSGMYAMSTGQQPEGSAFPSMLDSGPTVRSTSRTGARSHGKTSTGVIDAVSSSPNDYGVDNSSQGYFTFPEIGAQPNTGPMYQQGSRTSRRTGTLGV